MFNLEDQKKIKWASLLITILIKLNKGKSDFATESV